MSVTHTTVADLGEGWTPQGWTIALACGHVTDGVAHMQFSIGDSMICTEEHPSETVEAPQDHGPLAATLSERTLAKVLSRPAHVPSLVLLDRDAAAQHLADAVDDLLNDGKNWHDIAARNKVRAALADYRSTVQS